MTPNDEKDATPTSGEAAIEESGAAPEIDPKLGRWIAAGLPVAAVITTILVGALLSVGAAIVVLAGFTLVGTIAIFWASVRTLVGEVPLSGADAYALGAPSAEEEQKLAVLRALKDLEYEKALGKISAEDYDELLVRYRNDAKRLLRVLDDRRGAARSRAEALLQARLVEEGVVKGDHKADGKVERQAKASPKAAAPTKASASKRPPCAKCGKVNEVEARFCNRCGAPLTDEHEDAS